MDDKQVIANITINEEKPVGIALTGDWHVGNCGVAYDLLERDLRIIRDTEGLYAIGAGDYKDNYISGSPKGGQFGQIFQPGMQDQVAIFYAKMIKDKILAMVRGCHDHWDQTTTDRDFISFMCKETEAVNLWHGGDLYIKVGEQKYLWKIRHKYPFKSSLNVENSMRRIMEIQGPADIATEAHYHNPYIMDRHLMGEYRIFARCGSYKIWDEYAQRLGGYKGKPGVPVIILYPYQRKIVYHRDLLTGVEILKALRKNF